MCGCASTSMSVVGDVCERDTRKGDEMGGGVGGGGIQP